MTELEQKDQLVSLVYGNTALADPAVIKELVAAVVDEPSSTVEQQTDNVQTAGSTPAPVPLTEEEKLREKAENMGQAIADTMFLLRDALACIAGKGFSRGPFDKLLKATKTVYWLMLQDIPHTIRADMQKDLEELIVEDVTPPTA